MLPNFIDQFIKEINGIIHVGAHRGQEVRKYIEYNKKVVLFEPQKEIFADLIKKVDNLNNINCYNFALGSKNEISRLNKSKGNDGLSSSILTPKLHLVTQPDISFEDSEEVEIKRFDSLEIETLNFLTLDVQGLELEVLKGFGRELENVNFIFTEINTKYLYKNNALVSEIDEYLNKYNFVRIYTNIDCFNYFGDAFYVKTNIKNINFNMLNKIKNYFNITNTYLHFKKIKYPKRLLKNLIKNLRTNF
tara:strand:+ start:2279 stop:3022 length:744 start_codon:yes stop_codon:yes gene_type:complete